MSDEPFLREIFGGRLPNESDPKYAYANRAGVLSRTVKEALGKEWKGRKAHVKEV